MPSYAYIDSGRTLRIKAEELSKSNYPDEKKAKYFCCNPKCDAEMKFICGIDLPKPYFRANPSKPHSNTCVYRKVGAYNPGDFDERGFDIRSFIERTMRPATKVIHDNPSSSSLGVDSYKRIKQPLTSLVNVYHMLKYYDYTDYHCGRKIGDMLIDSRNIGCYKNGFWGGKIVEARPNDYFYEPKKEPNKINRGYLHVSNYEDNCRTQLELDFEDNVLFKWYSGKFFHKNKRKDLSKLFIIVSGKWTQDPNTGVHRAEIKSRRQIHMLELT